MTIRVEEISQELNILPDELLRRSISAFLAQEIRLAEWDIADIKDRYAVASPAELEEKIKAKEIYSHPAWEDLIEWENLEAYIARLRALQDRIT